RNLASKRYPLQCDASATSDNHASCTLWGPSSFCRWNEWAIGSSLDTAATAAAAATSTPSISPSSPSSPSLAVDCTSNWLPEIQISISTAAPHRVLLFFLAATDGWLFLA